ncbi:MAG: lytic transglycosylase domain-containing protein [Betaproteobacteria bacterium]|nr:lytic transglycosylase domain-containing protein [Betaproteobacteria bacterium]
MTRIRHLPLAAAFVAAIAASPQARADIFSFTDERGVVHFTNIPGLDRRYKLIRREAGSAVPRSGQAWMPSEADIRRFSSIIDVAARSHGVEAALVQAVITAESGFNPNAISRAGASGLMQLMPDTARRYGVRNIFDPVENIHGGVRYLRDLLAMFKGDMRLALAGYNAGENAVIRAGNNIPPYAETQNYVPKVIQYYHRFRAKPG